MKISAVLLLSLSLISIWPACSLAAEEQAATDDAQLTVERIFDSREFEPERYSARWLDDSSGYLTLEDSQDGDGGKDIVVHDPESGNSRVLVPAAHLIPAGESSPLKIDDYQFSKDRSHLLVYTNSKRVWRANTRGDYWVLDRSNHSLRKLGGGAQSATLMFAKLSPDGFRAAYVRERNIYVEDLRSHEIHALTTTPSEDIINGTFDWVYEEEFRLRDGFRWSPDGQFIAYWQINTQGVPSFPLVNNTDGFYPTIKQFKYPKTGERNAECRVGVVSVDGGETRWITLPGDLRNHYIAKMDWSGDGTRVVLQRLNRQQNSNHVILADVRSGQLETVLVEKDEAWVSVHDEMFWLENGNRFTWISERDGWRHAYLAGAGEAALATRGDWDVIRLLHVDEGDDSLYFLASPDDPTQRYLYRTRLDGSDATRLTPDEQSGTHDYQVAPDARWALHTYSSFTSPPTIELIRLPEHKPVRTLIDNQKLRDKIGKLELPTSEFLRVDIGQGVELDAWCIKPAKLNANKKYPLLVYVYGEPAGQTVLDRWGGGNQLWHMMLAQQGYVVVSVDNRGTPAARGRTWRKCVYRQVGILAPQDQAAAIQALLDQRSYLDPKRVGVWGWSGGGSMSLNAIFKFPDLYHTAISVAPVPNQRYYDTIYQERYMGLPKDNVEGYMQGSPIHFAKQLKGNLLLIHGTGDDNCHYQTTEMLINELIRQNKPFSMMAYPNRSHSIREGKNTTLHLRRLMTTYLLQNLPPGPR